MVQDYFVGEQEAKAPGPVAEMTSVYQNEKTTFIMNGGIFPDRVARFPLPAALLLTTALALCCCNDRPPAPIPSTRAILPKPPPEAVAPAEQDRRTPQNFALTLGTSYETPDGITVSVSAALHDFLASGGTSTSYSIDFERGPEKTSLMYDHLDADPSWYAEGLAFGYLFTITRGDDLVRRAVTLTPTSLQPLSPYEQSERGKEMTQGALCGEGYEVTPEHYRGPGTYAASRYNEGVRECTVVVGLYTQKVVFSRDWREKTKNKTR